MNLETDSRTPCGKELEKTESKKEAGCNTPFRRQDARRRMVLWTRATSPAKGYEAALVAGFRVSCSLANFGLRIRAARRTNRRKSNLHYFEIRAWFADPYGGLRGHAVH